MSTKEHYMCVYDPGSFDADSELEVTVHASYEAALIQRVFFIIKSIRLFFKENNISWSALPDEFQDGLCEAIADEQYSKAFVLWDAWVRETDQECWIGILSANTTAPRQADLITEMDTILDFEEVDDLDIIAEPKESGFDESFKEFCERNDVTPEQPIALPLTAPVVETLKEDKMAFTKRDAVVDRTFRVPAQGQPGKHQLEVTVSYTDGKSPKEETITLIQSTSDLTVHRLDLYPYVVGRMVTVVRKGDDVKILNRKAFLTGALDAILAASSGKQKGEKKEEKPMGEACAVPKIHYEILSR